MAAEVQAGVVEVVWMPSCRRSASEAEVEAVAEELVDQENRPYERAAWSRAEAAVEAYQTAYQALRRRASDRVVPCPGTSEGRAWVDQAFAWRTGSAA